MKQKVKIGNTIFVFEYKENEVFFYVELPKTFDQYIEREDCDFSYEKVRKLSVSETIEFYSYLKSFVARVIKNCKPSYFQFSANTKEKINLYKKFAKSIKKKFPYDLQIINNSTFYFFRSS